MRRERLELLCERFLRAAESGFECADFEGEAWLLGGDEAPGVWRREGNGSVPSEDAISGGRATWPIARPECGDVSIGDGGLSSTSA